MSATNETAWTNRTVDVFRSIPHIDCKPNGQLLKQLTKKTLEEGARLVSQQSRPTEGTRSVRLDAWKYVRRVSSHDMVQALRAIGCLTPALQDQVSKLMQEQNVYHVVIRGNDPKFMPLGKPDGRDIVTSYFLETLEFIHEEVEKLLFDEIEHPDAIQAAMDDSCFDQMLQCYFLGGDTTNEETLHVVSRFKAGANLLHTVLKEGYAQTLQLLLDKYTIESHGSAARWRVLAEPLHPCGKYKCSAFHRAVFDGRSDCLRLLVGWAERHGHNITKIVNVEERNGIGEASKGLTCLELAEQEGNHECFNILAPVFGAPLKEANANAASREIRLAARCTPRLELVHVGSLHVCHTIEFDSCDITWQGFLDAVRKMLDGLQEQTQDLHKLSTRAYNLTFLDDATEDLLDALFSATAGMFSIEAHSCASKTDKTSVSALRVLVQRLSSENAVGLPTHMPSKVELPSSIAEDLSAAEEAVIDAEAAELILCFIKVCGQWPKFMGAPFLIGSKQVDRISTRSNSEATAACHAARFASRLSSFLVYNGDDADADDRAGMESWLRKRALMPLARSVSSHFNPNRLLASDFQDPLRAIDASVIPFIQMVMSAWFATVPQDSCNDAWLAWANRLGVSEAAMKQDLAPALDTVLESILRMWKVLDPVCKQPGAQVAGVASVGELMRKCIPVSLLGRLPSTRDRLEKYYPHGGSSKKSTTRISLLSSNQSFRPSWG